MKLLFDRVCTNYNRESCKNAGQTLDGRSRHFGNSLWSPTLLALIPLALTVSCGAGEHPDGLARGVEAHPNVILISLDTLRADHLGCYGNEVVKTPNLDVLAEEGVRFAAAQSIAPTTLAAHTSMFTGTWPHQHGVLRNGFLVHPDNQTMAELLLAAGYHTAGFVGSFALASFTFVNQGFEHYDQEFDVRIRKNDGEPNQRRAAEVTNAVLQHVDQYQSGSVADSSGGGLFLFAHYFDAHHPYEAPGEYGTMYGDGAATIRGDLNDQRAAVALHHEEILGANAGLDNVLINGLNQPLLEGPDGEAYELDLALAARYAGEVSYLDHHLGRLFDGLRERGLWDNSLVIVTADHGETFWEHADFWNHGLGLYRTTIDVPLLVKLPKDSGGAQRAGQVVERPVSSIDVLPTVLDLLNQPAPGAVRGRSLTGFLAGAEPAPSELAQFAESTQPSRVEARNMIWAGQCKAKSVRRGDWKYIWTPYLGYEELFDLSTDPEERHNLLRPESVNEELRTRADSMRAELEEWAGEASPLPTQFFAGRAGLDMTAVDALEMLKSLGYTEGGDIAASSADCLR